MPNFFLDLFISGITGLVAALFAVRISLHKFASQKWWERCEEAYAKIIGILSKIRVYLGNWEEHYLKSKKLSQDELNALNEKYKEELEKIELLASEGAFRISDKSNDALNNLIKSLNRHSDEPIESIGTHYVAVKKCIDIIRTEAEKDLRIKKKWYQL